MIAIKRLQSIMWILVVAMGALAAYLISLRVATERNAVRDLIDQIRWTRAEIRYLEAEFGARASMRQLAAWNQNDLRLYVPAPGQYLPDEQSLAKLDRIEPAGQGYAAPPVMTAMATRVMPAEATAPAAVSTQVAQPAASRPKPAPVELAAARTPAQSEFALIRTASAAEPRGTAVKPKVKSGDEGKFIKPAAQPDPEARKAARLALLDAKLLGSSSPARTAEGRMR